MYQSLNTPSYGILPAMEKLTFTLPKKLRAAIAAAAAAEGRDPSSFVRFHLADKLGVTLPAKAARKVKNKQRAAA